MAVMSICTPRESRQCASAAATLRACRATLGTWSVEAAFDNRLQGDTIAKSVTNYLQCISGVTVSTIATCLQW